jgi:hypothetical protein
MAFIGSLLKFITALGALCVAIFLGLQLEPEKEMADRVLLMLGVGISTFSPIGLILYVKFWEQKPNFSSACGKQALIGLVCLISHALLTHYFPQAIEPWTK